MRFDLRKPCAGCPFLRDGAEAVRLRSGRVREVWQTTRQDGPTFACHKTVNHDDEDEDGSRDTRREQHCAGAFLAGIASGGGPNQLCRIAARMDRSLAAAMTDERNLALVFASLQEMRATAIDTDRKKGNR